MNWITEKVLPKFKAFVSKKETDEILWIKCKSCSQMIFHKEYSKNLNVCMSCGFHGYIDANSRLNYLCDENTIEIIKLNYKNLEGLEKCLNKNDWPGNTKRIFYILKSKHIGHKNSIKLYNLCKDYYNPVKIPKTVVYFDEVRKSKKKKPTQLSAYPILQKYKHIQQNLEETTQEKESEEVEEKKEKTN